MRKVKQHIAYGITGCIGSLLISACSTTRTVPEGDRLYTGHSIVWADKHKPKDYGTLSEGLNKKVRPLPNRRFAGLPLKLWMYNLGKEPKGKGLNYLLRKKWGEPPVLLSSAKADYTSEVLTQYLGDNGYFQANVTSEVKKQGKKKASIVYTATPEHRYTIDSVAFETDSSDVGRTVAASKPKSLLEPKDNYSLDKIRAERERIHAALKEQGYYYFTPDYLLVQVDSTNHGGKVNLFVKIKPTTPVIALRPYRMHDIILYPDYSLDNDSSAISGEPVLYHKLKIIDPDKRFKPIIFDRSVFLKPDSLYRLSSHNITLQRLINLGTFKFVKGQFYPLRDTAARRAADVKDTSRVNFVSKDSTGSRNFKTLASAGAPSDSGWLNARFYLTPYPRRSLQAEVSGVSKSNNFVGSELRLTARNRNWLHAANLLEIGLSGGMEWQTGGRSSGGTSSYSLKGEVAVTFPRFITPIRGFNIRTPYVPRTRISVGYELFSRKDLYNLNGYTAQLQYLWKRTQYLDHILTPIAVTYVLPTKTTPGYDSILLNDPGQRRAIEKQFILGGNYTITFNNQGPDRIHGFYISGNLDISGNIAGLLIKKAQDSLRKIFNNPFAQYERISVDARHYWKLNKKMTWVNRLFAGYGLPYGNSLTLPFVKQYFTGGSSSIRAFRARTLGPGSYKLADSTSTLLANEAGDIKLEYNSELRMHLTGVFNAAVFVDAGNIWLQKQVPDKPGSQFHFNTFYKEIAVGAGAGLRIDASIVVVRLDLAFPLRKPWLPQNERWVFKQINFGDPEWRKENLVLNIAIGYPF